MKKTWIPILLLVSVFFLLTPAMGEEYISKDFPSNEIILKNLERIQGRDFELIGKTGENYSFEVYVKIVGMDDIESFSLIRLDTNRWLTPSRDYVVGGGGLTKAYEIFQK